MSTMKYVSESGRVFEIESVRCNLSGKSIGFYVWDEDGNLVHEPVDDFSPVEPFATISEAEAFADGQ